MGTGSGGSERTQPKRPDGGLPVAGGRKGWIVLHSSLPLEQARSRLKQRLLSTSWDQPLMTDQPWPGACIAIDSRPR